LIAISTDYCKELLLITQVCSNPTCGQRKIFYPPSHTFIVINNYLKQDLALEKKIELWIEYYANENGLLLNFLLFQLQFS